MAFAYFCFVIARSFQMRDGLVGFAQASQIQMPKEEARPSLLVVLRKKIRGQGVS